MSVSSQFILSSSLLSVSLSHIASYIIVLQIRLSFSFTTISESNMWVWFCRIVELKLCNTFWALYISLANSCYLVLFSHYLIYCLSPHISSRIINCTILSHVLSFIVNLLFAHIYSQSLSKLVILSHDQFCYYCF